MLLSCNFFSFLASPGTVFDTYLEFGMMGRISVVLLFIFLYQILVYSFLTMALNLCPMDQSLNLWKFKQSVSIDTNASVNCDLINVPSFPKINSWNKSTDCCNWGGVTCDRYTGQVIGLDLSCSQIQGVLNSNSTLFQLSHLQSLNLAFNNFSSSLISINFSGIQSLKHLNLSSSGFSGLLSSELLRLVNLMTLDISSNGDIVIQPLIFKLLLQNLTQLREVSLADINIGTGLPRNLSASLEVINLYGTSLFDDLPLEILQLPNLQMLQVSYNVNLTGSLSRVEWSTSSALSYLDLSGTGLSGELPESIGNLKSLYHLDLSFCNFLGAIPESLGNLSEMNYLNVFSNNFNGQVPSSLGNLDQLITLVLSGNSFEGQVPNFFSNFTNLADLSLSNNRFEGYFPSSIINLTRLESLYLTNNFLTGPLPSNISGFSNLIWLQLEVNSFNGTIPSWVFCLPSLTYLYINSNQFTGQLHEFQYQTLQEVDLNGNKLHGSIPKSISGLLNLTYLDLSNNNFGGDVEVSFFSNLQLTNLRLSFNNLSLISSGLNSSLPSSLETLLLSSCGVKNLDFLEGTDNLATLDLSNNMLYGEIFTDQKWRSWGLSLTNLNLSNNFISNIHHLPSQELAFLDIRSNRFSGPLIVPSITTQYFFASANNFSGEIPSSICNLSSLVILDLSNNNLSGVIPPCLGNMSIQLSVLDMRSNHFQGTIPSSFPVGSKLRSLNLHDNLLVGKIPQSLSNCKELEVVDLGKNNLNDTFPWWLKTLPKLQVLSLRANHLGGPVSISGTGLSFPALRILDLSQNQFTGTLPAGIFVELVAMKIVDRTVQPSMLKGLNLYYQDTVLITIKGEELDVVSVLSILTVIDLSSNKFEGFIPDVIGNLISLEGLNFSHNQFCGEIPTTVGNLTSLEFLDLSSNQMEGGIPDQLTALTYLSVLNLSSNRLVGRIPEGNQFNTFQNTSYLENEGLCGFPLTKTCGDSSNLVTPTSTTPTSGEEENEGFIDGFTWEAVLIGYGSGIVIGMSMGGLSFITRKPKWFNKFVEQEGHRIIKKKWPREVKWLSPK